MIRNGRLSAICAVALTGSLFREQPVAFEGQLCAVEASVVGQVARVRSAVEASTVGRTSKAPPRQGKEHTLVLAPS